MDNPCPFCGSDMPSDHGPESVDYPIAHLPGQCVRKKPAAKSPETVTLIRKRAWNTRRQKYGPSGHR